MRRNTRTHRSVPGNVAAVDFLLTDVILLSLVFRTNFIMEAEKMRKGFTLIELLVVIAIIAILAAILFPVFARAREKARQSSCLSNTKQIILGCLMYGQDYDERIPCGRVQHNPTTCDNNSKAFYQHVINPYVKNQQVFACPSQNLPGACGRFYSWAGTSFTTNYGINCRMGTSGGPKLADVPMPAEIFYVVCGNNAGGGWWRGFRAANGSCTENQYYREIHNGGVNIGMVDGHAKWIGSSKAFANTVAEWSTYVPWQHTSQTKAPGY